MTDIDKIPLIREVLFVGEHFTLMTSISLEDSLREEGESEDEFAIRLASESFHALYGWDVRQHSTDVGVLVE